MGAYWGGSSGDAAMDVAVDDSANIYVAGVTDSRDFPTTANAIKAQTQGDIDTFISKFEPSGALVYSTLFGGTGDERPILDNMGVAVDSEGSAYLAGTTWSQDFPTTAGAYDSVYDGGPDAWITKLDPTGALSYATLLGGESWNDIGGTPGFVYSTFLGGTGWDYASDVAVDSSGNAYVTGTTEVALYTKDHDSLLSNAFYVYVAKLSPIGDLLYRVGVCCGDAWSIAVDSFGRAYVTGSTSNPWFPVTPHAFDRYLDGTSDAFVFAVNAEGTGLVYATFLGGSDWADFGRGIAVDPTGDAYVAGSTSSVDFPTSPGAFDTTFDGESNAFLARFDGLGQLRYSTFLGGTNSRDRGISDAFSVAVDPANYAYVTGITIASSFSTTPAAYDATYNYGEDAFVAKVGPTGGDLVYSSFLGGAVEREDSCCGDRGMSIAVDLTGNVTVVGETTSMDFPTTELGYSPDVTYNGRRDAFVARIELVPEPNRRPVAAFETYASVSAVTRVLADATLSADAEDVDALLQVRWDWEGDGTWDTDWSAEKETAHEYPTQGAHTIRMEVRDTMGLSDQIERTLTLSSAIEPLTAYGSSELAANDVSYSVQFHASASGGNPPYSFEWDFGDGATSDNAEPVHAYAGPGTFNVTLTVTDAYGRSTTKSLQAIVAPTSSAEAPGKGSEIPAWIVYAGGLGLSLGVLLWVLRGRRKSPR